MGRSVSLPALAVLAALLALAACEARPIAKRADAQCTGCHGGADGPAPPKAVNGATSTGDRGVGAHQAHVATGAAACEDCHPVPGAIASPGHMDGVVDVVFSESAGGSAASWDRSTATCAVYCHGATLAGGTATRPVWTQVDGTQAACGACHGIPPPAPHVASTSCGSCHSGYTSTSINAALHGNGTADISAAACGTCHAIPPATGRHGEHVEEQISCGTCHAGFTATSAGPSHLNGAVDVSAPGWNASTRSCANACHGTEQWNGGGGD